MRKAQKSTMVSSIERYAQSYHETNNYNINYAFQGFRENLYFTSDRTIKLDNQFRVIGNENKALKGFGLEIELGCQSLNTQEQLCQVLENICFQGLPKNLFKYQRDGSLSGRSTTEAITQVMTKEFIRNNYPNFKAMYQWFKMFEISANNSCGMHVNMSNGLFGKDKKTIELAIKKFVYFINKHYKLSCMLVKRNTNATSYCSQMMRWTDKSYAKNFDLNSLSEYDSSHGICFNIAHYTSGRVELRLVGGQTDYYCFRNTMETIFHLIDAMKELSWDALDDITKVFKGCNKYVVKRLDDAYDYDLITSEQLEIIKQNSDTETDFGNC